MLRRTRTAVAVAVAVAAAAALPAAASAQGAEPLGARAHVLTAGPYAGRVAVHADVVHLADPDRRIDIIATIISRHGQRLASGTDHTPRPRDRAVTASHLVLLSAAESRRARAAARGGHRLRVTVTTTPGDGGAARVATATVALGASSAPPLAAVYSDTTGQGTFLWVDDGTVSSVAVEDQLNWIPNDNPRLLPAPGGGATWASDGRYFTSTVNDPGTGATFSGTFSADGSTGTVTFPAVAPILAAGTIALEAA